MKKLGLITLILLITNGHCLQASPNCPNLFLTLPKAIQAAQGPHAPLLSAESIVQIYEVLPHKRAQFIYEFNQKVRDNFQWNYVHNPRLTGSGASLLVDMYRFKSPDLSTSERESLIHNRVNVAQKIEWRHVLFQNVRHSFNQN